MLDCFVVDRVSWIAGCYYIHRLHPYRWYTPIASACIVAYCYQSFVFCLFIILIWLGDVRHGLSISIRGSGLQRRGGMPRVFGSCPFWSKFLLMEHPLSQSITVYLFDNGMIPDQWSNIGRGSGFIPNPCESDSPSTIMLQWHPTSPQLDAEEQTVNENCTWHLQTLVTYC